MYTLLLEAVVLAGLFGLLWLSFWAGDRRRSQGQPILPPAPDFTVGQQDSVDKDALVIRIAASTIRPTIAGVTSDVQPAGEKDEAILYRSEHAQYFNDKPQVQPEQHQRA